MKSIINGEFTPRSLRVYLAAEISIFYSLIFYCWLLFPVEHAFSIHTHTFSFLGSFNEDRNPPGWWLFCIAMTFWGLATIPVVRYIFRQRAPATAKSTKAPRTLLTVGALGIILVGLFPDARDTLIGPIRWTSMHYVGALVLVLGFLIGIPWTAVLVRRASRNPDIDGASRRAFAHARWPQALFLTMSAVAIYFLVRWIFVYENLKVIAEATGREIGSSWREAMNTPYSFPLWDNVFVQTLFVYLVWTALAMPNASPGTASTK